MTLYAHRGWSTNSLTYSKENTLEALTKSSNTNITGVEIDVRRHPKTNELVLSHDPINPEVVYTPLKDALVQISNDNLDVLIELKELDSSIYTEVTALLNDCNLIGNSVLFGFEEVVKDLPWQNPLGVKLGIIVEYPWDISKKLLQYKPSMLLLGWDDRLWTYVAFRSWWSIASLSRLSNRAGIDVVVGVATSPAQLRWLSKQKIKGYTVDMELCK